MFTCLQKIAILDKYKEKGIIKDYTLKAVVTGYNKEKHEELRKRGKNNE